MCPKPMLMKPVEAVAVFTISTKGPVGGGAGAGPIPLLPLLYYKRNATGAAPRRSYTAPLCWIAKTAAT